MANRLANSGDVSGFASNYPIEYAMSLLDSDRHPAMTLNDIIIDTRTSVPNNAVFYSNMSSTFSGARAGFTLWIADDIAGSPLQYFNLTWGGAYTAGVYFRVRALGGKLLFRRTATAPNNATVRFADFGYIDLRMTRSDAMGWLNPGIFPKGTFGMRIDSEGTWDFGAQGLTLDGDIKGIKVDGIEDYGMFAAFRLFPTQVASLVTVEYFEWQNSLVGQGIDGEGIYMSESTGTGPYIVFEKTIIRNVVITGRPLENFQIQHFVSHSHQSLVENVISHNSATDWRGEVNTIGQSQNFQIIFEEGNTIFRNVIVDGTSANCWFITSGDQGSPVRTRKILIDNCYCGGTKYRNGYIQSGDLITPIEFNNCDFDQSSNEWAEGYLIPDSTYHIHIQEAIEIIMRNNTYHSSMALMGGTLTRLNSAKNTAASPIAPQFVNIGLPNNVEQWNQNYGAKLPNHGNPIHWNLGKIVFYRTNGRYYKCILAHDSTSLTVPTNTTYWVALSWDTHGVRSDQVGWASGDIQSIYDPPWDFRLIANSVQNVKRRGLPENLDNTQKTHFVWQTATDNSGSNMRRLYRFKDKDVTVSDMLEEIPSGNYVRRIIYVVDAIGTISSPGTPAWLQVT